MIAFIRQHTARHSKPQHDSAALHRSRGTHNTACTCTESNAPALLDEYHRTNAFPPACRRSHNCCSVWRMCPHQYHPSPHFQSLMVPLHEMNHYQQHQRTGAYAGMCWLDGFLMWPVPHTTQDCSQEDPNLDLDAILQRLPEQRTAEGTTQLLRQQTATTATPQSAAQQQQQHQYQRQKQSGAATQRGSKPGGERPGQTFCIHRSKLPVVLTPHTRTALVDGYRLPAAEDLQG